MSLKFVSLFTGIGGLDLGFERAGLRCVAQVEIDPFCRLILSRHWPRVPRFDDVRTFGPSNLKTRPDVICGGFPCQDISSAGRKVGITGARSGLWKEMLRVIRAFQPSYVLVENVTGLRSRGLSTVLADLAASGFDAEWDCLPAASFGAVHIRNRIFIFAHARRIGHGISFSAFDTGASPQLRGWLPAINRRVVAVAGRMHRRHPRGLRMGNGISPKMVRLRTRGCGNAVYPPAAEWVGQQIIAFDEKVKRLKHG